MNLGTVVMNERVFSITSLYFKDGQLNTEIILGPKDPWEPAEGRYLVFGSDGELVVQAWLSEDMIHCVKSSMETWYVTFRLYIEDKLSNRARERLASPGTLG